MTTLICINDLSEVDDDGYSPKKIIENEAKNQDISSIFFYSNSLIDLCEEKKSSLWINYASELSIPLYACINSVKRRKLQSLIPSPVKVTGLGRLIEEVINNEKTIVIGKL